MSLLAPFVLSALFLTPQSATPIDWIAELRSLETRLTNASEDASIAGFAIELGNIRAEMAAWSAGRPVDERVTIGPLPAGRNGMLEYARSLREALSEIERTRPGGAFQAGRIEVNVVADALQVPTAATISGDEIREQDIRVLPDALNLVPGLTIQRMGPRNERGIFVRGFDVRQVPLYIDGIPVYVPYDGYVDLDRFLTYGISEIQVARGFTSPLYGPNAIGGAVNVVTKEPAASLNVDLGVGYDTRSQRSTFLNVGSRGSEFWVAGDISWLDSNTFPLSGDFATLPAQPDRTRDNAYQTDARGSIRVGWTPGTGDQYTFTYAKQHGEKGNPTYAGTDPNVQQRFWQWPYWDKESFYFIGDKGLGDRGYLRFRLYYDRFDNLLESYDDASYSSQTRPYAFTSPYDDDTYGATVEFGTARLARQSIKTSFYFKDDTHREGNIGQPQQSFRDQSFSFGVEDTIDLAPRLRGIVGFGVDHIRELNAEDVQGGMIVPFPQNAETAYNPQAGLFYSVSESDSLHFTFARKTRLPTMKDRYSYRMGQAIPNPDLEEEISYNWEVGYGHVFGAVTTLGLAVFRSDISGSTEQFFLQPNLFQLRNIGEARHFGAEFAVRSVLRDSLILTANYTYLSRKNESQPDVLPVHTPGHKVYASTTWRLSDSFTLMSDLAYEANRWTRNNAGRYRRLGPYALLGIGGSVQLRADTEIQVGVNNLFDRNYEIVDGYPEAGRSGYVNLRYAF